MVVVGETEAVDWVETRIGVAWLRAEHSLERGRKACGVSSLVLGIRESSGGLFAHLTERLRCSGRSVCGLWQVEQLLGGGEVDAVLRLR